MAKKPRTITNGVVLAGALGALAVSGPRADANGQPVQRYTKDLIRVGDWINNGKAIAITPEDLAHWAATFAEMKTNGVKVYIPSGHTDDADANRGYVEDIFVDGDTLYGTMDLIGDDAIKMASRVEVSIYVPDELTDGKGNVYKRPIAHVALTPTPVVSGQGGFVPIKLSRGAVNAPMFRFAINGGGMETLKKIAAAMGLTIADDADEAGVEAAIMAKLAENKKPMENAQADKSALVAARAEVAALKAAHGKAIEVDPDALHAAAESAELKLSSLVSGAKITKAVADKLSAVLIGTDDARPALCLSRKAATAAGMSRPLADAVLEALKDNDPVKLGEQTRTQALTLARYTPGDTNTEDPDLNKRAESVYGRKTA